MTTTPQRFTKRPVTIEAIQLTQANASDLAEWCGGRIVYNHRAALWISTLEGVMEAQEGDWIIRGVQGEFYPCKPDIFTQTYEPAAEKADISPKLADSSVDEPTDAEVEAVVDVLEGLDGCDFATIARAALVAAREVSGR